MNSHRGQTLTDVTGRFCSAIWNGSSIEGQVAGLPWETLSAGTFLRLH